MPVIKATPVKYRWFCICVSPYVSSWGISSCMIQYLCCLCPLCVSVCISLSLHESFCVPVYISLCGCVSVNLLWCFFFCLSFPSAYLCTSVLPFVYCLCVSLWMCSISFYGCVFPWLYVFVFVSLYLCVCLLFVPLYLYMQSSLSVHLSFSVYGNRSLCVSFFVFYLPDTVNWEKK